MPQDIKIALLGRNSIVREGLHRILAEEDFQVIQSVDQPAHLHPETDEGQMMIVVDGGLTGQEEAENLRQLQRRFPQARLVILSDSYDFDAMVRAFRLGVHGYIVKEISCKQLVGSLQLVAMGEKVMPSRLADTLSTQATFLESPSPRRTLESASLSDRELEILRCLIMGCPNKIISRRLEISEATVKVHVKAILRKLKVQNRTQAAIWGVNRGVEGFGLGEPASAPAAASQTSPMLVAA